MLEDTTPHRLAEAIELLQAAHRAVAITGAGISTPSGIPDFRSPASGLWERADPLAVSSIFAFRRQPEAFYGWFRPLAMRILQAEPNPAHMALAQLETYGPLKALIPRTLTCYTNVRDHGACLRSTATCDAQRA